MKKYIIACLGIVAIGTSLSSCKKITDLKPISSVSDANFWQNSNQVTAFVTGIHVRLRSHNQNLMYLGELRSDIFGPEPGTSSAFSGEATQGLEVMWNQTLDKNNPGVSNFGGFYDNINQINLLIAKIPTVPGLDPELAKTYLGMAYGLRAFYYFQLYKNWGASILVTEPYTTFDIANLAKAASPAEDVLKQVKSDIDESNNQFASYNSKIDYGYWSKAATQMLKAEVYLWTAHRSGGTADATIAKTALTDIQTNVASFALRPTFSDVFTVPGNSEIIFASKYVLNEATMAFIPSSFTPQTTLIGNYYKADSTKFSVTTDNWSGALRAPTRSFIYNQYSNNDLRKKWSVTAAFNKSADGKYTLAGCFLSKFPGVQNAGTRQYVNDYPIYRYADLLLMLAEAKVILGENIATEINLIRQRAYGAKYNLAINGYPNLATDVVADQNEVILKERLLEFVGEGKRWSDLRRFGDNYVYKFTSLPASASLKLLWPVDLGTLTNNRSLKQTPGYDQ